MNAYQLIVLVFSLICIGISIWAVIAVARSPFMRFKLLWIVASLCGFVGLGIDWTIPSDMILLFGFSLPVTMIFKMLPAGHVFVKSLFPIPALVALNYTRRPPPHLFR